MHPRFRIICLSTFFAALACAGCTPLFSKNPNQWRDGRIASIVSRATIPAGVDDHCLGITSSSDAGNGMVAIVTIRLGRRRAGYKLVLPISDGQQIHVGDDVIVQPQPCKLELGGVQTG